MQVKKLLCVLFYNSEETMFIFYSPYYLMCTLIRGDHFRTTAPNYSWLQRDDKCDLCRKQLKDRGYKPIGKISPGIKTKQSRAGQYYTTRDDRFMGTTWVSYCARLEKKIHSQWRDAAEQKNEGFCSNYFIPLN